MKTLDLSRNYLGDKTGAELATAFTAIPKQVKTLDLSWNYLDQKTGAELATAFVVVPKQVETLDLSRNGLNIKSPEELRQAFSSLPKTVTTLDLSYNNLYRLPLSPLLTLLQALPESITCIGLSHNELFTHRTLPQRDEFLQALGTLRENGRLNLAHNGESEASRAFLPLKTLAQKHASPDLLRDHILFFLTPIQEYKISKRRHHLDVKLAPQSKVTLAVCP